MPTLLEGIAARIAFVHARRTYRRFLESLRRVDATQQRVLERVLSLTGGSDFGRRHGLASVHSLGELKRAVPLTRYEDLRPYIDRLRQGDMSALFSPGQRLLMFATSSGTTARPKFIPVTPEFVRDYRRGWNTFGLK
ncbi:MAG TPA: GH3 auxin-responsive promoter family protein, partial [Phycisphaerae bacterium]|nr:GH3 auxin-responsive promoter family protein [Phycisphaerae bacterium]